jgi:hypothetical protein
MFTGVEQLGSVTSSARDLLAVDDVKPGLHEAEACGHRCG